jgi:peptidylprolyl isomerase
MIRRTLLALIAAFGLSLAFQALAAEPDPENVLVMELKDGEVRIALRPDLAPKHVERLKTLTRQGFYDGIVFHRVIEGFMAQTGDPTGTGSGGSDLPDLPAEFSNAPFVRGVLGMARTSDPNSANSQFFITYAAASHLNGQYTVFGEVIDGMDVVDSIKKGSRAQNGLVSDPDKIIRMRVAADIQ